MKRPIMISIIVTCMSDENALMALNQAVGMLLNDHLHGGFVTNSKLGIVNGNGNIQCEVVVPEVKP